MTGASCSVVLAAGGMGMRMGSIIPKQYLEIRNKPLALYSFETFLSLPEVNEIIVVCGVAYQDLFKQNSSSKKISFALPGKRRQDSVFNGLEQIEGDPIVCIHDAARPFIKPSLVRSALLAAVEYGSSVIGVPVKATIKMCNEEQMIVSTPDRSKLWEMQTPQMIRLSLLKRGYAWAHEQNFTVTDDVSLVELIGEAVKVVNGDYTNIKITTPEDLILAERLLERHVLL